MSHEIEKPVTSPTYHPLVAAAMDASIVLEQDGHLNTVITLEHAISEYVRQPYTDAEVERLARYDGNQYWQPWAEEALAGNRQSPKDAVLRGRERERRYARRRLAVAFGVEGRTE